MDQVAGGIKIICDRHFSRSFAAKRVLQIFLFYSDNQDNPLVRYNYVIYKVFEQFIYFINVKKEGVAI